MHVEYSEAKKSAFKFIIVLAIITIGEVFIALMGKGYIGGMHLPAALMGGLMIALSLAKAYIIIKEYMHMGHEVKSMAMSVLLPVLLLVWAVIAFLWEGGYWNFRRSPEGVPAAPSQHGSIQIDNNSYRLG